MCLLADWRARARSSALDQSDHFFCFLWQRYHLGIATRDQETIQAASDTFMRIGAAHFQDRCKNSSLRFQ